MHERQYGKGIVTISPLYRSELADALLPGNGVSAVLLRSDFSEMLGKHLEAGGSLTLETIGGALAAFTPQRITDLEPTDWKTRIQDEWCAIERPQMFMAMEAYFLDGGLEARVAAQYQFFLKLVDLGVQFGNLNALLSTVIHAGDWHKAFHRQVIMGRDHGIQLTFMGDDRAAVTAVIRGAGFSEQQRHEIESCFPVAEHLSEGLTAKSAPRRRVPRWLRWRPF